MKYIGIALILLSVIWGLGILILYSGSMMNDDKTMWYSFICLFIMGVGIFSIIIPKNRNSS